VDKTVVGSRSEVGQLVEGQGVSPRKSESVAWDLPSEIRGLTPWCPSMNGGARPFRPAGQECTADENFCAIFAFCTTYRWRETSVLQAGRAAEAGPTRSGGERDFAEAPASELRATEVTVSNKANWHRDQVSGIGGQQADTRYPTPEPCALVQNEPNSWHRADREIGVPEGQSRQTNPIFRRRGGGANVL